MYIRQNTFNFASKSDYVAHLPPSWRQAYLINDGVIALRIQSWRVSEQEKRRQARKIVWPVYGRVTCHHQNHLYGITINIKEVAFLIVYAASLSIITMNHIDTGAAAAMRSVLWRTWLLGAGSCNFTHSAVRGNKYSFASIIHATMLRYLFTPILQRYLSETWNITPISVKWLREIEIR